jgi:hypothetical protein
MEKICKNCKYFYDEHVEDGENPYNTYCKKILLKNDKIIIDYYDKEKGYAITLNPDNSYIQVTEDFGCNLFEYKEVKLDFNTQCDDEICTSCSS